MRGCDCREVGGSVTSKEPRTGVQLSNKRARDETSERVASLVLAAENKPHSSSTHHTQIDYPLTVAFEPADLCVELRSVSEEGA